jgi:hypothetical protein
MSFDSSEFKELFEKSENLRLDALQKVLGKWRKGKALYTSIQSNYTYLKVAPRPTIGDVIETSRGVVLNYEQCQKAYRIVKQCIKLKTSFSKGEFPLVEDGQLAVGNWSLDRITANGDVIAGCHTIKYDEIKAIAKQENW